MKKTTPSTGLQTIMEFMAVDKSHGSENLLDTIHFRTTQLHGRHTARNMNIDLIGRKERENKIQLLKPFFTTIRLFEQLPHNAKLGVALGQALAGLPVMVYQGMPEEMKELVKSYDPKTIYSFGPERTEMDIETLKRSNMILIEQLSRTSDPPSFLPEIRKGKDVIKMVSLLNELVDIPVIYNIDTNDIPRDLDFILISNVDSLMLSSPPYDIEKRPDITMVTSMITVNRQMEIFKSQEKGLKIIANGQFRDAIDILKMKALGADMVGLDDLTMSFLRSYLSFKTGEKIVNDQDLIDSDEILDWAEIGELYGEFIQVLADDIVVKMDYLNIDHEKRISIEDLETSDYGTASITGLPLQGFGAPVPFWRHRS